MAPLPNSLSPERDLACGQLATYLQTTINAEYAAIRGDLVNPFPEDPVKSTRDWNAWNIDMREFPVLCCYRMRGSGRRLQSVEARISYYLKPVQSVDSHVGTLTWVGNRISAALEFLQSPRGPTAGTDRVLIKDPGAFTCDFAVGLNRTTGVPMAWLEFQFQFQEVGV